MSSILEALRELEGQRPPATRRDIPPADAPEPTRRAAGAVIPILGGVAVGILVFGLWALGPRLLDATRPPATPAAADVPAIEAPTADRPNWLDTAEAPRARVTPSASLPAPAAQPPARRAPTSPASAATPAPSAPTPPPAPVAEPADTAPPARSGGQVAVESISYASDAGQRVAVMRVHGKRVSLRQRESVDGIEVQLIMPNGVYVQRGSEVYLLPLSR